MDFTVRILGSCEVHSRSGATSLGGVKPATLLVVLLSQANRPVSVDRLLGLLWEADPPRSAVANLRTYVRMLRNALRGSAIELDSEAGGYLLRVRAADCDHLRFAELLAAGSAALDAGTPRVAAERLKEALALWRGTEAAEGIPRHGALAGWLEAIDEERMRALERIAEAWIALGEPHRAAHELNGLLAAAPLRSRSWWLKMLAHHRLGEHGRALSVYREAAGVFRRELGIDPDPQLSDLYRSLLRWDLPVIAAVSLEPARPTGWSEPWPMTHRAPDPPLIVGRRELLVAIRNAVRTPVAVPSALRVVVLHGPTGVGTSAVALQAARELAERYPDGQLYLDLRGSVGQQRSPGAMLRVALRMLGVEQPPDDPHEAGDVLRTISTGQRLLLVVDNATAPEQVRPLLCLGIGCCVLVASRYALGAIQASRRFAVPPLTVPASAALLRDLLDPDRATGEDLEQLGSLCAGLPLALRIAAARLIDQPSLTPAKLIARLRDDRQALAELETDDLSLRARLHEVLGAVTAGARAALVRLAALGEFALPVAARRLAATQPDTEAVLDELARVHLVVSAGPGRYRMPRFVRLLAAELKSDPALRPVTEPSRA